MFEKILKKWSAFARVGLLAVAAMLMLAGCGDETLLGDGAAIDRLRLFRVV